MAAVEGAESGVWAAGTAFLFLSRHPILCFHFSISFSFVTIEYPRSRPLLFQFGPHVAYVSLMLRPDLRSSLLLHRSAALLALRLQASTAKPFPHIKPSAHKCDQAEYVP